MMTIPAREISDIVLHRPGGDEPIDCPSMNIPSLPARRAAIVVGLAAIAHLASCSTVREITEDHSAIADPYQRWRAYEIYDYDFRLDYHHADSITGSYHVQVEEGQSAIVRDLTRGRTYGKRDNFPGMDFDAFFREIGRGTMTGWHIDSIEYDPRFGFPRRAFLWSVRERFDTLGQRIYDDTMRTYTTITDFRALNLDY